jgi:hypothetical protein
MVGEISRIREWVTYICVGLLQRPAFTSSENALVPLFEPGHSFSVYSLSKHIQVTDNLNQSDTHLVSQKIRKNLWFVLVNPHRIPSILATPHGIRSHHVPYTACLSEDHGLNIPNDSPLSVSDDVQRHILQHLMCRRLQESLQVSGGSC